jgi:hypothetical protein
MTVRGNVYSLLGGQFIFSTSQVKILSIINKHKSGMLSSLDLGFARLCLAQLKIYMPAGGRVVVRGMRSFGK